MCLFLVKGKKKNWCKNQTISQREEGEEKRKLHWLEGGKKWRRRGWFL